MSEKLHTLVEATVEERHEHTFGSLALQEAVELYELDLDTPSNGHINGHDSILELKPPEKQPIDELYLADPIDDQVMPEIDAANEAEDLSYERTFDDHGALQEIFNHPILTKKEEVELAKRIEKGDLGAKDMMICCNMRLVANRAVTRVNRGLDFVELVQAGVIGLIRASEKFDYRRGLSFGNYAYSWINVSMDRAIDDTASLIRLPVHKHSKAVNIYKAGIELTLENRREATDEEIAEYLKMDVNEVRLIQATLIRPASLDTPLPDGQTTLGDILPDPESASEYELINNDTGVSLEDLLEGLTPMEVDVVKLKVGLGGYEEHTLVQIGKKYGISTTKVRKIYDRSTEKVTKVLIELSKGQILEGLTSMEVDVVKLKVGLDGHEVHTLDQIGKKYGISPKRASQIYEQGLNKINIGLI